MTVRILCGFREISDSTRTEHEKTPDESGVFWSGRPDSNRRHSAWKADTLPTELLPHGVGVIGLEPTTSASQTPRATNCATPRSAALAPHLSIGKEGAGRQT